MEYKNWYQAETDYELNELLDMFWGFHDYRIEKVNYTSESDQIDLLLKDDTQEYKVVLRFIGDATMNFVPVQEYEASWLLGAALGNNEKGRIVWAEDEDIDVNDLPNDALWIAGDSLYYALLDENENRKRLPEKLVHQVWRFYSIETGKYEVAEKEFHPRCCTIYDD